MTTPGGSTIGYGYDILNRLMTVTHPDTGGKAVTLFGYDKVGNRQSVSRTNAAGTVFSTTTYIYDSLNRLTDIVNKNGSNGLVSSYHYGLRADGKRYSVTESGPATSNATINYFYDDQGKLTEEAGPYADIKYGYDNVGNRLTRTVSGSTTALLPNGATNTAYDVNDRIVGHTYDLDGNETTVNGQAASYDFENHLVSLGSVASYVYDANGNRYSAANLGTTTSYVVDTSLAYASVVEEYSGTATAPSARYDYGDDLVRMDRGGVYYYLYDGLGSTRQLMNTVGAVTDTWGYSAFGELASHTGTTANPFLFNAQQFDQASGVYYLRARYYDQSIGRFISQDPYGGDSQDPVSLHRYLYANVDPLKYVDPSGQDGELVDVAFSMAISAEVGGVLSYAAVKASGGSEKLQLRAAIYGGEAGFSLAYAYANGNIGMAVFTGLLGGFTVFTLDALGSPKEFAEHGQPAEDFIEGFATGAATTAFSGGMNAWGQGALAAGFTFSQDLFNAIVDNYPFSTEVQKKEFTRKLDLGFWDALTTGIIAMGAGVSAGTQFGGKVVKEAEELTQGKTAEEVSEKVVASFAGVMQYITSGFVKIFDVQGKPEKLPGAPE